MIDFFALHFADGEKEKALNLLDSHHSPLRKKDAVILTYFAGLLTMVILFLIALIAIPQ